MVDLVKIRKKAKARDAARLDAANVDAASQPDAPTDVHAAPAAPPQQGPVRSPTPPASETQPEIAPAVPVAISAKLERFRETAGKRRESFAVDENLTAATDIVELLTFLIGTEQYAVPIEHLVEIITPRTPTPVPNSDAAIVGIISLRGAIVTVIDVRRKLKHRAAARAGEARIIVAERNGETLGFEVDRVLRVIKVTSAAIEAHPVVHASELSQAVGGVFRHMNALTILLDLDKLLA